MNSPGSYDEESSEYDSSPQFKRPRLSSPYGAADSFHISVIPSDDTEDLASPSFQATSDFYSPQQSLLTLDDVVDYPDEAKNKMFKKTFEVEKGYGFQNVALSDDELTEVNNDNYLEESSTSTKGRLKYRERSLDDNMGWSRSSLSESSPNDQNDEYKTSFDDAYADSGTNEASPSPQSTNDFYSSNPQPSLESLDEAVNTGYSDQAKKMMFKMGFKVGKGLGKFEHGRTEPVEASTQKGRRGLGLAPSIVGKLPKDFKWTPDDSVPSADEEVLYMPRSEEILSGDILEEWLVTGPKKLTIEDEHNFVDETILKGVLNAKTIFDKLQDADLRRARSRCNPYEKIGSAIFLNRAAVKMANIDAIFDFVFTKKSDNKSVEDNDLLYFADVCAGPGGFSEYVLYRRGWRAKGFGFTLKGGNDFKLEDFIAGTAETFNPYYGVQGDGNIFNPENLTSLKNYVLNGTEGKGVHFLMADGGFSVEGQENIQEILSKQLYLCQCLAALMLVRNGGHFVVKLFDVFTLFSVGLIYIMNTCFEKVSIHKPVTSRPANSERYLVCLFKKQETEPVERHLYYVNTILWKDREDKDVIQLVPLSVIRDDSAFYKYIYESNCMIATKQIRNLLKIAAFNEDKELEEPLQEELRLTCLEKWKLPGDRRKKLVDVTPDGTLSMIISNMSKPPPEKNDLHALKSLVLNGPPNYLENVFDLRKNFRIPYDWHMMFLSSEKNSPDLTFYIGCGRKQIYRLEGVEWKSVADLNIMMPAKTLLYGEIIKEYVNEGRKQSYNKALHIIDAIMLGGVDISHYSLTERINQCAVFCSALEKRPQSEFIPIRCKRLFNMNLFQNSINKLTFRCMKRVKRAVTIEVPNRFDRTDSFYSVAVILFIKEVKEPWIAQISKKTGYKYYYSAGPNKESQSWYEIPMDAKLDMLKAFSRRVVWVWEDAGPAILNGELHKGLTRVEVEKYINSRL